MDDSARRKEELRKRLRLSQYPRRRDAAFTDENGHNPWILEDCPECGGNGKRCTVQGAAYLMETCAACEGLGTTSQVVRCFPEDGSELEAVVDAHGWITCPGCERRFSTRYPHPGGRGRLVGTWTGRRHLTCGQLVRLVSR